MENSFDLPTRWNIFARELENILTARGLRLGQLDDRGIVLHREKVRRLQQSLNSPRHLTTMNPDEMERLIQKIHLTDLEQKRLHAALLATAVEMTLLDRVDPQTALMASDDVFNILFATMRAQPDMVLSTGVKDGAMIDEHDTYSDNAYNEALYLIDRAVLAVHVSNNAASLQAKVALARQALDFFMLSLEMLQQCQTRDHESEDWRYWYGEADDGRRMAELLMRPEGT